MTTSEQAITIIRILDASPEALYAAWTDPQIMQRWMGSRVKADVRVGGHYRIEHDAGEGVVFVHTGAYQALEPARRIRETFAGGRADAMPDASTPYTDEYIEVRFRPLSATQTELTFVNGWGGKTLDEESMAAIEQAWKGWLDALTPLFGAPQPQELT